MSIVKDNLSLKRLFYLWLPLFLAQLIMTSEGGIYAGMISRSLGATQQLAAFGVAFEVLMLCESPIFPLLSASNALSGNLRSYRLLQKFSLCLSAFQSLVLVILSLSPICSFICENILSLSSELTGIISQLIFICSPSPMVVACRRFYQGLIISQGKTRLITYGTIIRVLSIVLSGWGLFQFGVTGAVLPAYSMMISLMIEAATIRLFATESLTRLKTRDAQRHPQGKSYSQDEVGEVVENISQITNLRDLIRFYLPLAITSIVIHMQGPFYAALIARGKDAVTSLAILTILQALMGILSSSGAALMENTIAVWNSQTDRTLARFTQIVAACNCAVMIIMCIPPVGGYLLQSFMGVDSELARAASLPLFILIAFPFINTLALQARGIVIANKKTRPSVIASFTRFLVTVASLFIFINIFDCTAIILASISMLLGDMADYLVMRWYTRQYTGQHTGRDNGCLT